MPDPAAPCVPGAVVELSTRVRRLTAPNPGVMTGPGTNTYLVGTDDVAVIDPGPADEGHVERIAAAGGGRIRWILTTHTHLDHSPGAASLRRLTGAAVLGYTSRDGLEVDRALAGGDALDGGTFRIEAVHTPGHASNHLCYRLDDGWLFSGDHLMQGSTVVITPPDGDMAQYLESLQHLLTLELTAVAPGHGTVIPDAYGIVRQYIDHRLARESAIVAALASLTEATIEEIVTAVYVDVPAALHPVARFSVFAHLLKLRAEERVGGGPGIDDRWTAA